MIRIYRLNLDLITFIKKLGLELGFFPLQLLLLYDTMNEGNMECTVYAVIFFLANQRKVYLIDFESFWI